MQRMLLAYSKPYRQGVKKKKIKLSLKLINTLWYGEVGKKHNRDCLPWFCNMLFGRYKSTCLIWIEKQVNLTYFISAEHQRKTGAHFKWDILRVCLNSPIAIIPFLKECLLLARIKIKNSWNLYLYESDTRSGPTNKSILKDNCYDRI